MPPVELADTTESSGRTIETSILGATADSYLSNRASPLNIESRIAFPPIVPSQPESAVNDLNPWQTPLPSSSLISILFEKVSTAL